jgi:hypothetical protein
MDFDNADDDSAMDEDFETEGEIIFGDAFGIVVLSSDESVAEMIDDFGDVSDGVPHRLAIPPSMSSAKFLSEIDSAHLKLLKEFSMENFSKVNSI